ncbi:hypothetical protein BH20GEM3_BH20GEM3_00040 [soil metagenome]
MIGAALRRLPTLGVALGLVLVVGVLGAAQLQAGWTAGATHRPRPGAGVATLREVRVGQHRGFDRTVWEFEGARVPGYRIEYIDRPVRQCGSGHAVPLAGQGWLAVQLSPARAHDDRGQATVRRRGWAPRMRVLRELKLTCDFEAEVVWTLGVASPNRYRVLELTRPARLVVDVRH